MTAAGSAILEFGSGEVATVDVTFLSGAAPVGEMQGPSLELASSKAEFGSSRIHAMVRPDVDPSGPCGMTPSWSTRVDPEVTIGQGQR